jgi:peptidyl-prolyl cis-trans isomerase B (cyclophilin B)
LATHESREALMKALRVGICVLAWLLCLSPALAQLKDQKFTPEEIKKMAETSAVIETKFGNLSLRFFPDVAPNHVKNFIDLAKKGFYDGTLFHRVIAGYMIQGGDPNSKNPDRSTHGYGGPGYNLKAEFNEKPHLRGTLSTARRPDDVDSAGSQFFICVAPAPRLDRKYTVFGEVVSGMEVADKIVSQPRDKKDNPLDPIAMKVKIVEK